MSHGLRPGETQSPFPPARRPDVKLVRPADLDHWLRMGAVSAYDVQHRVRGALLGHVAKDDVGPCGPGAYRSLWHAWPVDCDEALPCRYATRADAVDALLDDRP